MTALGVLQGLALWGLYRTWPDAGAASGREALWMAAVYFVCASGLVLHMARSGRDTRRLLGLAGGVGLAFAAVALWVGWQIPPESPDFHGDEARYFTWMIGAAVAIFALGPFLQIHQQTGRAHFPYPDLYRLSWSNFFVAALAAVHVGAVWALLLLWARLFQLIGIEVFHDAFTSPGVVFAVTGGGLGYGLAASRENERVIGALRGVTRTLFRAVLPVLAGGSLVFLGALPFTGLEGLFGATSAATLLLGWLALGIVLLNAVHADGREPPPYARPTQRVVEAGVVAAPALAALAVYAIGLRVDQHGLTPQRMFAALLAGVLSLHALGYAAAVLRRSGPWLALLPRVNVAMAFVWVGLAFAVHTPLLDPLAWSLRSQLQRLEAGRVDPREFDFAYLRFHLGREGAAALERLAREASLAPAVRERIGRALSVESYWAWHEEQRAEALGALVLERVPDGAPWPAGLREAIRRAAGRYTELRSCAAADVEVRCLVALRDLDGDGSDEALAFVGSAWQLRGFVFVSGPASASGWSPVGGMSFQGPVTPVERGELVEAVASDAFEAVAPVWPDIEIRERRLRFDGS